MNELHSEQPSVVASSSIVQAAQAFMLKLHNQHPDARRVFHNYSWNVNLTEEVKDICQSAEVNNIVAENSLIAAWLLPAGFLFNYHTPTDKSLEIAQSFFSDQPVETDRQSAILQSIKCALTHAAVESKEDAILSDAYQISEMVDDFEERNPLLHLERELLLGEKRSLPDWRKLQLQNLLNLKLYTHEARLNYEDTIARLIRQLKEQIQKQSKNQPTDTEEEGQLRPFQDIERKLPTRATQTFFRANFRNHINLSAIADNKASIMININSALITVLIAFLSYRNIATTNPQILLPVIIFLVTGLASLVFAILAARPRVTMKNEKKKTLDEIQRNIIFFGNFVTLDLDQFEQAMDAMLRDGELLYGNMTRDLYFLGKVLDKKYRYLSISYNIFMVGFIITVGIFLVTLF